MNGILSLGVIYYVYYWYEEESKLAEKKQKSELVANFQRLQGNLYVFFPKFSYASIAARTKLAFFAFGTRSCETERAKNVVNCVKTSNNEIKNKT